MQIFKNPNFDFVRWRWHAIVLSLLIIGAGMAKIATQGMPLGVEFEGGTILILKFEQTPDVGRIRDALSAGIPGGGEAVVQRYGTEAQNQVSIRTASVGTE